MIGMSSSLSTIEKMKRKAEREKRRAELEQAMEDAASGAHANVDNMMAEVEAADNMSVSSGLSHSTGGSGRSGTQGTQGNHSSSGTQGNHSSSGTHDTSSSSPSKSSKARSEPIGRTLQSPDELDKQLSSVTDGNGRSADKNSNKFMESQTWGMDSVSVNRAAPPLAKTDSARNFLWAQDDDNDDDYALGGGRGVGEKGMFGPSARAAAAAKAGEVAVPDQPSGGTPLDKSQKRGSIGAFLGNLPRFRGFGQDRSEDTNQGSFSSVEFAGAAGKTTPKKAVVNLKEMQLSEPDSDRGLDKSNHGGLLVNRALVAGSNAAAFCSERKKPILILVAAVAAVVASVLVIGSSDGGRWDVGAMPSLPSLAGGDQSGSRFKAMKRIIVENGISDPDTFDDTESPQYRSLLWLAEKDEIDPKDPYMPQRYALSVFFLATHDAAQLVDIEMSKTNPKDVDFSANWVKREFWLSDLGICSWHGIRCHHRPGGLLSETTYDENNGVVGIELAKNFVRGPLVRELFIALPDLVTLDLTDNELIGTLPTEIGMAKKLVYLKLESNSIEGTIPPEIGNAKSLQHLQMGDNLLEGSIPKSVCDLDLHALGLFENVLNSTLPVSIGKLVNIHSLYLDSNSFTGEIPVTIAALKAAKDIRLRRNSFGGTIPTTLGGLTELTILYLDANEFTGTIPTELGQLSKLQELSLYKNILTGPLPEEFGNLEAIKHLYLDHNKLTSTVPSSWGSLRELKHLFMYNNKLVGHLPNEIGEMISLEEFRADSNALTSKLPASLGRLVNLKHLILNDNYFVGQLPPQLGYLVKLDKLIVHNNDLTGDVPTEVCELTRSHPLDELEMDCGGIAAKVQCDCCTACH